MIFIKQISVYVILIGIWVLFAPTSAYACSCDLPYPGKTIKQQVSEARRKSRTVFFGEVVEIIASPQMPYVKVRFIVERSWKGILTEEAIIVTGQGGGDCGYHFEVGESYLVFAYGVDDTKLETNICQRTKVLAEAVLDLKLLGKGKPIAETKSKVTKSLE